MSKFEILVRGPHEAERVTTAFYRFLETQSSPSSEVATVQTEILGDAEKRTVRLWSDDAVRDFEQFLSSFRLDPPRGLWPAFGARGKF